MKINLKHLEVGQEVALQNCRETGTVVRRVAKNLYAVRYKGAEIEIPRINLGVRYNGQWKFGPVNAN